VGMRDSVWAMAPAFHADRLYLVYEISYSVDDTLGARGG
jgi:hypothetical protein